MTWNAGWRIAAGVLIAAGSIFSFVSHEPVSPLSAMITGINFGIYVLCDGLIYRLGKRA